MVSRIILAGVVSVLSVFPMVGWHAAAESVPSVMDAPATPAKELGVGDHVPDGFSLLDIKGKSKDFEHVRGAEGVVLLFIRSSEWCQYCQIQIEEWNANRTIFEDLGYPVVFISYDDPQMLNDYRQKHDIRVAMLSDADSAMIKAFGILNEKFKPGSRFYGIPEPAIYVVDYQGKITHLFREEDYAERPDINEVIIAIGGEPLAKKP